MPPVTAFAPNERGDTLAISFNACQQVSAGEGRAENSEATFSEQERAEPEDRYQTLLNVLEQGFCIIEV